MKRKILDLIYLLIAGLLASSPVWATNGLTPGYISNSARTQSDVKTALEQWVLFDYEHLGAAAESTLITSGNAITPPAGSGNLFSVDTSGGAGNLDNIVITNVPNGRLLLLRCANPSGDPVTVRNMQGGSGQISLFGGTNFTFTTTHQWLLLKLTSTTWEQVYPVQGDSASAWNTFLGLGTAALVNTGTSGANVPTITQADGRYAAIGGSTSQAFNVSNTGSSNNALSYTTAASTYAPIAGNNTQTFNLADPTSAHHGVSLQYGNANYYKVANRYVTPTGQTFAASGSYNFTHSLGATPTRCWLVGQCTTANGGYSIGDQIVVFPTMGLNISGSSYCALGMQVDSTKVYVYTTVTAPGMQQKGGGGTFQLNYSDWEWFVYAEL